MLNLNGALRVYTLIGKHLPEPEEDVLSYLEDMIGSIIADGEQEKFMEAFVLLSGKSPIELVNLSHQSMLQLLGKSLIDNHILELKKFCQQIGL